MFGLKFLQALGFFLLLCQVGGELRDPLLKQLLLLYLEDQIYQMSYIKQSVLSS